MIATVGGIKEAVARVWGIDRVSLVSNRRSVQLTRPRFSAYRLCRTLTPLSLPAIGRHFGGRDHTSILHGLHRADTLMAEDEVFAEKYRAAAALAQTIKDSHADSEATFWDCAATFKKMAKVHGFLVKLERN